MLLIFSHPAPPVPPVVAASTDDTSHVFLAWGNLADNSILSGGSWSASLPLANLKNRTLARVARSTDLALASTTFDIDVGADKTWRVLALVGHNLSLGARHRILAGDDATFATYEHDTGWEDVWPAVYSDDELEFGDLNWWEATYTEEERQGYTWTHIHRFMEMANSRYVRVEIDDVANANGYVDIGRLFIANGWFPSRNINVGAALGWQDDSEVQRAYGGSEYFNELPRYRVARFTIAHLEESEAYSKAFEMMRQAGVTREVLIQWNGDDTVHALRRQFVGRLRQLSPIEYPYPLATSVAFEIKESQ